MTPKSPAEDSSAPAHGDSEAENPAALDRLDIRVLVEQLEALVAAPDYLVDLEDEERRRLQEAAGRVAFPDRHNRRRFARIRRQNAIDDARARDVAALEATSNRTRKRALAFPLPPPELSLADEHRLLLERQARIRDQSESQTPLIEARNCYVCKQDYRELHHHYDSLCPPCARLNWEKREQTADLRGRVALVTGSRVKIGFEIALMLLRAGAQVEATTRFTCDAAERFEAEPDFGAWGHRLRLHAVDLRNTPAVERFCAEMRGELSRLDFLIHNACQTVRRPPAYYAEMVAGEDVARLSSGAQALIRSGVGGAGTRQALAGEANDAGGGGQLALSGDASDVASLSLLDLLDEAHLAPLFPSGMRDGEGQPLDLRDKNSWRLDLHEVPTVELLEVQLVNAIAPFVLNAGLKPLMLAVDTPDKHIVHVSAMEGQFYRSFKTTRHPHTNMAKAALNMMTRTSASDFAKDGIHMNSVDTGWVTDEDPFEKTVEKEDTMGFSPPLDSVDGAARVLDPIFSGFATGEHVWGQFLKDYASTRW